MLKKVEKSGVYRYPDGSAVHLTEGAQVDERVLAEAKHDEAATKAFNAVPERGFVGATITDAPQDVNPRDTITTRAMGAAPENKAMNQPAEQKSDADLAADKAKK